MQESGVCLSNLYKTCYSSQFTYNTQVIVYMHRLYANASCLTSIPLSAKSIKDLPSALHIMVSFETHDNTLILSVANIRRQLTSRKQRMLFDHTILKLFSWQSNHLYLQQETCKWYARQLAVQNDYQKEKENVGQILFNTYPWKDEENRRICYGTLQLPCSL